MILDRDDPHRGRCGHHHDRHRSAGAGSCCADLVRRCCVLVENAEEDRHLLAQAKHLAASFEAELAVADLRSEHDRRHFATPSIAGLHGCHHKLSRHDLDALLQVARSSDVVIVDDGRADAAAGLATLSGRPFLAIPPNLAAERIGSRVVIFWTKQGCSAAALRDVLPWLRDACSISIAGEHVSCAISYLEAHGFLVEAIDTEEVDACARSADLFAGTVPARLASQRDRTGLLISPSW